MQVLRWLVARKQKKVYCSVLQGIFKIKKCKLYGIPIFKTCLPFIDTSAKRKFTRTYFAEDCDKDAYLYIQRFGTIFLYLLLTQKQHLIK